MRPGVGGQAWPGGQAHSFHQGHLNTHDGASLYETFAPAEARRILDKIAFHDTPKHGSWLEDGPNGDQHHA